MADTPSTPLTQKTLERLRALAKGNVIEPSSIKVIETNEAIYKVHGQIRLEPHIDVQTRTIQGRIKSKGHKMLSDFAALQETVQQEQQDFSSSTTWLDLAIKELKSTPGLGWGHGTAQLKWDDKPTVLGATEHCPSCRGSAQSPCYSCQGLGFIICTYCHGRGKEICPTCSGSGRDATDPNKPCITCHGQQYSDCRFCKMTGKLPCPDCQGKGHLACGDCKGTGFVSRELTLVRTATLRFALGATTDLPSGLLRMMQRVGETNLFRHADIAIKPAAPNSDEAEDLSLVLLEASLPYAEIKMAFGDKRANLIAFGKMGRLSGVPPYLDIAIKEARNTLARCARSGDGPDAALQVQITQTALHLVLEGKTHPNELRRLYPIGLSAEVAQEIMRHMGIALKNQTKSARGLIGWVAIAVGALLFAGFYMTPLYGALAAGNPPILVWVVEALLPLIVLGLSWAILIYAAGWELRRKYPNAKVGSAQTIGRTGLRSLVGVIVAYVFVLVLSGRLPTGLF